ncbi:RNA polymerase sigma factor [Flagellimonas sp.]|uniref:RNA polymerase sigma factor n=1 Tax=Flagellimonas sp. TaxID=2058762 RepID=UPI003F49C8CD
MTKREEREDILDFVAGDKELLEDIYFRYYPVVKSFVTKNSGTEVDAKDVFQDALVFTYQKLKSDSLDLNCSLTTYIFAVCRNIWMNTLRKRKKSLEWKQIPEITDEINSDIIERLEKQQRQTLFHKSFLSLGETCQKVLRYFFSGKSMIEISELMDYSVGYTRKKKFECKARLIEIIEGSPLFKELYKNE